MHAWLVAWSLVLAALLCFSKKYDEAAKGRGDGSLCDGKN
jgi:hypothetical protein